jgi:hypothetical protein
MPTKNIFFLSFSAYNFLKVDLHKFSRSKVIKKSQKNRRNQDFSYFVCLIIEGSGSVPLTNRSGTRRPKKHTDPDPVPDPQHWIDIERNVHSVFSHFNEGEDGFTHNKFYFAGFNKELCLWQFTDYFSSINESSSFIDPMVPRT